MGVMDDFNCDIQFCGGRVASLCIDDGAMQPSNQAFRYNSDDTRMFPSRRRSQGMQHLHGRPVGNDG